MLDAAERLFASHGVNGVSSRQIVAEAGVNLAAIHYHFGSKDAILESVYERRAKYIADERTRRLEELLALDETPTVEAIIAGFLIPSFRNTSSFGEDRFLFAKLRSRLIVENSELARELQAKYFNKSSGAYLQALQKVLPALPKIDLCWRFTFLLGAMVYVMADLRRIEELTNGAYSTSDREEALRWMVAFFSSAFKEPALDLGGIEAVLAGGTRRAIRGKRTNPAAERS